MPKYNTFSLPEKWRIISEIEKAPDKRLKLKVLGLPKSTYYDWLKKGVIAKSKAPKNVWNKTPEPIVAKIKEYRLSGDPLKQSPARIIEQLENNEGYLLTESGAKSVLRGLKLNNLLKPQKKHFYIRPRAEKFLQVVCFDDVEFIRFRSRDTFVLNFIDEASYYGLKSMVLGHRTNQYDIIEGLEAIKRQYGKYPKIARCDNAQAHRSKRVRAFCEKHNIVLDFIDKGCPEENWPVESFHRNLNQDIIYRHGFDLLEEWQKEIDEYLIYHNTKKRWRSDYLQRTPHEIAYAYTSYLTQARIKARLQRKFYGQTKPQKQLSDSYLPPELISNILTLILLKQSKKSVFSCPKCA